MQADWKEGFKKKQVGVSDMTLLTTITNEAVNENLSKRWKNGEIYTYIGGVLISVNPFKGAFRAWVYTFVPVCATSHPKTAPVPSDQLLTDASSLPRSWYLYR